MSRVEFTKTRSNAAIPSESLAAILAKLPHDNEGPQLNFTIWLLTGLSLGFLGLRVYCKFLRGHGLWWDDYVLIGSWLSLSVSSLMTTVSTAYGYGKHIWDIPFGNFTTLNLIANIAGTLSLFAALLSKTSFAMTVLRISTRWMRTLIWLIIISVNVVMGVSMLLQWIRCTPVRKVFVVSTEGTCLPTDAIIAYNIFSTSYSGTMDIVLAIVPWKIIGDMCMNRKEKLGVLIAMSMGVFAGLASLIKTSKIKTLRDVDSTQTIQLVMLGIAEGAITIIAASIPILRALLRDKKFSGLQRTTYSHSDEVELSDRLPRNRSMDPNAMTAGRYRGGTESVADNGQTNATMTTTSTNSDTWTLNDDTTHAPYSPTATYTHTANTTNTAAAASVLASIGLDIGYTEPSTATAASGKK